MSKISTVYDGILTRLSSLLPSGSSYTRIPNSYNLDKNPIHLLIQGYGLRYDGASPSAVEFHQFANYHDFTIILSREVMKTDTEITQLDTACKALLENATSLQKDFYNISELSLPDDIRQVNLGNISSIQDLDLNKKNFKYIEVTFSILIAEDL